MFTYISEDSKVTELIGIEAKRRALSPGLQAKIRLGERQVAFPSQSKISTYLAETMRHCNGGRTVDAGLWLRDHVKSGKRMAITLAGAASTFQMGRTICPLIQEGHVSAASATAANLEESVYRLVSNDDYAYIPKYTELTPAEEKELDHAGLRRITDTFLPEEETVRRVLDQFLAILRKAEETGKYRLWHEYFFELLEWIELGVEAGSLNIPPENFENCWLYQAMKHNVAVFVPGIEDSTMGNIISWATYNGNHPQLARYKMEKPISVDVIRAGLNYMHRAAEWYLDENKSRGQIAFVQLGGGIAADFLICVVPHLKKDFHAEESIEEQEAHVPPWAGFIEINSAPMSQGSYSGAGGKEKITWSKLEPDAFMVTVQDDYTLVFPLIAAIVLEL